MIHNIQDPQDLEEIKKKLKELGSDAIRQYVLEEEPEALENFIEYVFELFGMGFDPEELYWWKNDS